MMARFLSEDASSSREAQEESNKRLDTMVNLLTRVDAKLDAIDTKAGISNGHQRKLATILSDWDDDGLPESGSR